MAIAAAPAAAAGRKALAKKAAASAGKAAAAKEAVDARPQRGSWKKRAEEGGGNKAPSAAAKKGKAALSGSAGKWRRLLIAEFVVCVMLLFLSPLAKKSGEMGPVRFMKRGTATCAFFIILGLVSSAGPGAAKASASFGGLATLALLVDQREAFGALAKTLNSTEGEDDADPTGVGPDDSTEDDGPPLVEV